jgi:ribosomal protein S15P/S13E
MLLFKNYDNLSENVKLNLKDIYLEFRVLYFKNRIESIVKYNSFYNDQNNFNKYINELNILI